MICPFCQYEHDLDDHYGCPNCNGDPEVNMTIEQKVKTRLAALLEEVQRLQENVDLADHATWLWIDETEVDAALEKIQAINENIDDERARQDDVALDNY